jgi:acylaminoacyl-peptidase
MNRVILRCSFASASLVAAAISAFAQDSSKHPITFTDMIGMHRVAEPQISSDGKWVGYTVTTPDMDANRGASNIWIVSTAGGAATWWA